MCSVHVPLNLILRPPRYGYETRYTLAWTSLGHLIYEIFVAGLDFPVDFVPTVRKIFRQYFCILAHIYFHHFQDFRRLQLHDGLNTLLLHFNCFVKEFTLMEQKDLAILDDLVEQLRLHEQAILRRPRSDDFTDSTEHVSISTSS